MTGQLSGRDQSSEWGALCVRMKVAYVGTAYHGWQIQNGGLPTVQGVLREACSYLLGRPVMPMGAGRTDTGVHARGQVAHVRVDTEEEADRLVRALSRRLPPDIEVTEVHLTDPGFDSRRTAIARRYSYHLLLVKDIFRPFAWQLPYTLAREAMSAVAESLPGARDCSSFCKSSSLKDDGNVCQIDLCELEWAADSAIFHIRANRFLHHMVRILVGTLVEVGRGQRPADSFDAIFAARDRSEAGRMAPPEGLFLEEVYYPGDQD